MFALSYSKNYEVSTLLYILQNYVIMILLLF